MNDFERAVLALAERQNGVVTRRQAVDLFMSEHAIDRRVADGRWEAMAAGVFRIAGTVPSPYQYLTAAALINAQGAVSHESGAFLLHLDGFHELSRIDVSLPRTRDSAIRDLVLRDDDTRSSWVVRFHRPARLDRRDIVTVDGIACTTAARTLIDLAGPLRGEALENAFESARRFGLLSVEQLALRASDLCGRGRRGSREIGRLLDSAAGTNRALESKLEIKVWRLWRPSSLPRPTRQHWVPLADGSNARIDFALTDLLLAVEAEGFEFHGNRLRWKRDRRRVAMLEALGWRVLVITWDDATNHRAETLERLRSAIHERTTQQLGVIRA